MRRHALLGVLAALSCARQTTAWDYQCWDCVAFRASLCRYNFICRGGDAPATCHHVDWLPAGVECINAAGAPLSLKNTNDWCKNGWDVERPFCSGWS